MKKKQNRESSRKPENIRKNQKWSKSDLTDKKVAILCFKMEIKLIYKGYLHKTLIYDLLYQVSNRSQETTLYIIKSSIKSVSERERGNSSMRQASTGFMIVTFWILFAPVLHTLSNSK